MDFEIIESKENKLVKSVRKLVSSASKRREQGLFVLEGLRLCNDAAINGYSVETLIVSDDFKEIEKIDNLLTSAKRCVKLSGSIFKTLCDTVNPQGVLCVVRIPETVKNTDSISNGRYIMLENTADPSNLGAISRTAEALGLSGIIIGSEGCDPFSPKAQRAGMGALLRLPIYISSDIKSGIISFKEKGIRVFASVVSGDATDLRKVDFPENSIVLIGNEANGLTDEIITLSDERVTINMSGRAESLNAAAAAAIFMWQMSGGQDDH
ncbi:MAG: RNA methyltransferase [Clostridia bacterium]|nr:RNA methyltransferase [Clostridia bacterium]